MEQSHQLPSLYSLAVCGEKKSLFRLGKMPSFQAGISFSGVFFQQFPMMVVSEEHVPHFYWKTQGRALVIKQPKAIGGVLLSADLRSMSCSGNFGHFLVG